jgi:Protein of unknown function (DUF2934)
MASVVDFSKIAELRGKTDQDLLKIVGKDLERGLALASIAKAKQSALHSKAEVIYTRAKALLPTISEASGHELVKLEAKVNELGTALDQAPECGPKCTAEHEITALAHLLWRERGCPIGSPHEDWNRAERELRSRDQYNPVLVVGGVNM